MGNQKFFIFTSEMLIDFETLKSKLESFYSISKDEASFLYNKAVELYEEQIPEDVVFYYYRDILKRNLYEELYLSLDQNVLKWISKHRSKDNAFVLITHLKNYRLVFRKHLELFLRVFSPQEYNKNLYDSIFLKIVHAYAASYVGNDKNIYYFTSNKKLYDMFRLIAPNSNHYYFPYIGNNVEKSVLKDQVETQLKEKI